MIHELRVKVPGYSGPDLSFREGEYEAVVERFPYRGRPDHDNVCRKARAWLVVGIAAELAEAGETREHVLIVEAGQ